MINLYKYIITLANNGLCIGFNLNLKYKIVSYFLKIGMLNYSVSVVWGTYFVIYLPI